MNLPFVLVLLASCLTFACGLVPPVYYYSSTFGSAQPNTASFSDALLPSVAFGPTTMTCILRRPMTEVGVTTRVGSGGLYVNGLFPKYDGLTFRGAGGGEADDTAYTFSLPFIGIARDRIVTIKVWSGTVVWGLQFITASNVTSPIYGSSNQGTLFTVSFPGASFAYIDGTTGLSIATLRFIFQRTVTPDVDSPPAWLGGQLVGTQLTAWDYYEDLQAGPQDIRKWPIQAITVTWNQYCVNSITTKRVGQAVPTQLGPGSTVASGTLNMWDDDIITKVVIRMNGVYCIRGIQFFTALGQIGTFGNTENNGGVVYTFAPQVNSRGFAGLAWFAGHVDAADIRSLVVTFQYIESHSEYKQTELYGNMNFANNFAGIFDMPPSLDTNPVRRVCARIIEWIHGISFEYHNWRNPVSYDGTEYAARVRCFELDVDSEYISKVEIRANGIAIDSDAIFALRFWTSSGRTSGWWGNWVRGNLYTVTGNIAGVFGKLGPWVAALGFYNKATPDILLTEFVFDRPVAVNGPAETLKTITADNLSGLEQPTKTEYSYAATTQQSFTWGSSLSLGFSYSISQEVEVGLGFAKAKSSSTYSWSVDATLSQSSTVLTSETKTLTESTTINVPPHSRMTANVLIYKQKDTKVGFSCKQYRVTPNGLIYKGILRGWYDVDVVVDTKIQWDAPIPLP